MDLINNIDQLESMTKNFLEVIQPLLQGKKINIPTFKKPINAARFPYDVDEILGTEKKGVYVFWAMKDNKLLILYVGKGNIEDRFYTHIGKGYSWERNGLTAHFPNNFTIYNNPYMNEDVKDIITKAEFNVTAIIYSDSAISCIIESFLICALEPRINIECIREETLIARKNN